MLRIIRGDTSHALAGFLAYTSSNYPCAQEKIVSQATSCTFAGSRQQRRRDRGRTRDKGKRHTVVLSSLKRRSLSIRLGVVLGGTSGADTHSSDYRFECSLQQYSLRCVVPVRRFKKGALTTQTGIMGPLLFSIWFGKGLAFYIITPFGPRVLG